MGLVTLRNYFDMLAEPRPSSLARDRQSSRPSAGSSLPTRRGGVLLVGAPSRRSFSPEPALLAPVVLPQRGPRWFLGSLARRVSSTRPRAGDLCSPYADALDALRVIHGKAVAR